MSEQNRLLLPDLFEMCPWTCSKNPHHETIGPQSAAWVNDFGFFRGKKQKHFIESHIELLMAYTFPYADQEEFRTLCDFSNVLFVIDEITDEQSGQGAIQTGNIFLRTMEHGECEEPASTAVRFVTEFRDRLGQKIAPNNLRRFLYVYSSYLKEVGREAEAREHKKVLSLNDFLLARRENSAVRTLFSLCEYANGIDLPEVVYEDQAFLKCYWAAVDMVFYANDLYSYGIEHAHGLEGNNLLTVLMQQNGHTLQEAANELGKLFQSLVDDYVSTKECLPSFLGTPARSPGCDDSEDVDENVRKLLFGLEQWVIGNIKWSFETMRYFGPKHKEVERSLVVDLKGIN